MKACFCVLLACSFLLGCCIAETDVELHQSLENYLTEIYSYSQAQADQFILEDAEQGKMRAWHPDHPEWVYDVFYQEERGIYDIHSPFAHQSPYYNTGESYLRDVLDAAQQNEWLTRWNAADREAFYQYATRFNELKPDIAWQYGWALDNMTASQAVESLFESSYGSPNTWAPAVTQWFEYTCQTLPPYEPYHFPEGAFNVEISTPNGSCCSITAFEDIPLEGFSFDAFTEKGWQLRQGIWMDASKGFACLEKGNEVLAVILSDNGEIIPFSTTMLKQEKSYTFLIDAVQQKLLIQQANPEEPVIQYMLYWTIFDRNNILLAFESCQVVDSHTGNTFCLQYRRPDWMITETDGSETKLTHFNSSVIWAAAHLASLPTSREEAISVSQPLVRENIAITVGNVNLRQQTSSHSKSLAQLNVNVLLPVLSIEEGSSCPWIHTKLGLLEGYVSSDYTDSPLLDSTIRTRLANPPLPVAMTTTETKLFDGTGLFRRTIQKLAAGTQMHILFENGNWLYVVIPQGELDWDMDPNGTFGYINKKDVRTANLPIQLEF